MYGDGLIEINKRLQLFSGVAMPFECSIAWQDPLPQDETALRANAQADLNMGIVSKQNISERLGYDWDTEQERIQEQQQQEADVGAMALTNFDRFGFSRGGNQQNVTPGPGNRRAIQVNAR